MKVKGEVVNPIDYWVDAAAQVKRYMLMNIWSKILTVHNYHVFVNSFDIIEYL